MNKRGVKLSYAAKEKQRSAADNNRNAKRENGGFARNTNVANGSEWKRKGVKRGSSAEEKRNSAVGPKHSKKLDANVNKENDESANNTNGASAKYNRPNVTARNANAAQAKDVDLLTSGDAHTTNAPLMNNGNANDEVPEVDEEADTKKPKTMVPTDLLHNRRTQPPTAGENGINRNR